MGNSTTIRPLSSISQRTADIDDREDFLYRFDSAQPVDGFHVDGEIIILTKTMFTEMGLWVANG